MSMLNWPSHLERTEPEDRQTNNKFSVTFSRSRGQLRKEMENRMEVDEWRLDDVSGSGGDPGVVVRWTKDGREHAVACDAYKSKGANLRAVYLYLNETRKAGERPVETTEDQFAAAALPGEVDPDAEMQLSRPAHEILGIEPDAPDRLVEVAYEERMKQEHPDQGGAGNVKRLQAAKEDMLNG